MEISKNKYKIADLKIVMTTYHQKAKRQAADYLDEGWAEDDADGIIDLGQEFYEEIYEEYMPFANYDSIASLTEYCWNMMDVCYIHQLLSWMVMHIYFQQIAVPENLPILSCG